MTTPEMPADTPDMVPEIEYEVWQDGVPVAMADSLSDAQHYMAVYGQDGPVKAMTAFTYRVDGFTAVSPLSASPLGASGEGALAPLVPTEQADWPVLDPSAPELAQVAQCLAMCIREVPGWADNPRLMTAHCHATVLAQDLSAPSTTSTAEQVGGDQWTALEALAGAATSGPYENVGGCLTDWDDETRTYTIEWMANGSYPNEANDLQYFCALDPDTVLSLITAARRQAAQPVLEQPGMTTEGRNAPRTCSCGNPPLETASICPDCANACLAARPGEGEAPVAEQAAKLAAIISDDEVARVHGHANFGSQSPREVVNDGVRKYAVGYTGGHTQLCILLEHGLITKPRPGRYDASLTKKGKRYARVLFADAFTRPTPATPEGLRPFGLSPLEIERIRSTLIDGLEKAYWAGSEVAQGFDAAKEADAILSALQPQAQGGE